MCHYIVNTSIVGGCVTDGWTVQIGSWSRVGLGLGLGSRVGLAAAFSCGEAAGFQLATVTAASVAVATALVDSVAYELSSRPTHLNGPLSSDCGHNLEKLGQWPSGLYCRQV